MTTVPWPSPLLGRQALPDPTQEANKTQVGAALGIRFCGRHQWNDETEGEDGTGSSGGGQRSGPGSIVAGLKCVGCAVDRCGRVFSCFFLRGLPLPGTPNAPTIENRISPPPPLFFFFFIFEIFA